MFFTDSIESSKVFHKLVDILKFDNIVKTENMPTST